MRVKIMAKQRNSEKNKGARGSQRYEYIQSKVVGKRINENGKEVPVRQYFYAHTKKDLDRQIKEFFEKQALGIDNKNQYFGIVADNWIYEFFINDKSLSDRTKDLYMMNWSKYVRPSDIYHLPLEYVSASALQKLYNSLDCPTSALQSINKLMRRFYKYVEREGLGRNVTSSLVIPKKEQTASIDREIIVWTDEEADTILNSFQEAQSGFRLRFLIVLAYNTGCRISELLAVKYDDFSEEGLRINKQVIPVPEFQREKRTKHSLKIGEPKTRCSNRVIPLNEDVIHELAIHKAWQQEDMMKNGYRTDFLFTTDTGELYDKRNVSRACSRYYARIGIENKKFHTYRHTFGTNLCKKGVSIQTASALLGHSDINVTAKYYINVSANEKKKAVELLSGIIRKEG